MLARKSKLRIAAVAYGPALLLAFAAAMPGFNRIYSGHGGIAWLLLPFALPVALCVLAVGYRNAPRSERPARMRFAIGTLAFYAPASLAASYVAVHSIRAAFGLAVAPLKMWALFMSPFGLPFVW